MSKIKILFIGDVIGQTGLAFFQKNIKMLQEKYKANFTVVNGENSAGWRGITTKIVKLYKECDVDVITSGNHIWANKEIFSFLSENDYVLRPANYPSDCPGFGYTIVSKDGYSVAVVSLQGRTFMRDCIDCPFKTIDSLLTFIKTKTNNIVVDFHAEATSEKLALAYYLEGRVSAVVGTHTHVQTSDERILPGGTAYITDLGMVGSLNSMIGLKKEPIINNFLTQMPTKFEIDIDPPYVMSGACVEIEDQNGKACKIKRIYHVE